MIEFPHLMQVVAVLVSVSSLLATIMMYRGKAGGDKVASIEAGLADKASTGRVGSVEGRVHQVEERLSRAESRLEHMPDKDATHRLEMAIARLEGHLETMDERLKPVAAMANRVHEKMFEETR